MLEDLEFNSTRYRVYLEREKNNPYGLGDYPRRMIVQQEREEEHKRRKRNKSDDSRSQGHNSRD